uniref:Rhodanese domain-containing protein n=1 Tax=Aegilops tauschii subsp. strangulata TaxID=200361 RepID=A0A453MP79_AEGTS
PIHSTAPGAKHTNKPPCFLLPCSNRPYTMGSLRSSGSGMPVQSVDPEAACALLASEQYGYVDVRMWEDFHKGHVAGARNVPYYLSVTPHGKERNPHFVDQVAVLHSKEDRFLVGCRSGVPSRLATAELVAAASTKECWFL